MNFICLVFVFTITVIPLSIFAKTAVPVFLLCGQSNMVSMASVNDLSAEQKKSVENVKINVSSDCDPAKKGKWMPLGPGFGSSGTNFGLELMLGKTLSDSMPGVKIAFIKNAINGSPLGQASGWLPPGSNSGIAGTHFANMLIHVDAALKSFNTAYDTALYAPKWAGFVWLQGESDAMNLTLANAYEVNLGNLIKDIRSKLAVPNLPVILPLITTLDIWKHNDKIRAADVKMKETVKNTDTIETTMLKTPDGMHYDAAGQIIIGQVAAQRWLTMKYPYDGNVPTIINSQHMPSTLLSRALISGAPDFEIDLSGRKTAAGNAAGILITSRLSKFCNFNR